MLFRPAALNDLEFVVENNRALAIETEDLVLDEGVLRDGALAVLEERVPGRYWIALSQQERVGQALITYEWSDWRNRTIWWIQSVYVMAHARRLGVFRKLYSHLRGQAIVAGAGGLRLYVDARNLRAQEVYRAMGMNGEHYRVFEDMF